MHRALIFSLMLSGCTSQIGPFVRDIQLDSQGRVVQFERCTTTITDWGNRIAVDNEAVCERVRLRNPPKDTIPNQP